MKLYIHITLNFSISKINISPMEMLNLGYTVFNINDKKIDQLQFPIEEYGMCVNQLNMIK
jgi:hypothetical protein